MSFSGFQIHFDPIVSEVWLWGFAVAIVVLILVSIFVKKKALALRVLAALSFIALLLNPSLVEEMRESVQDVATIVVDQSASQSFGQRTERTDAMLDHLRREFAKQDQTELRVVEAPRNSKLARDTRLFDALDQSLIDVPADRRAGVILLTDGQVHDVPETSDNMFEQYGPVHTVLSGKKKEQDRQIVIVEAPAYGITGQEVTVKFRVEDYPVNDSVSRFARVTINGFEGNPEVMDVPTGEDQFIQLPVRHGGQNIYELSVEGTDREITLANNRAALVINGVRDRLKVLLVSGRPHAGGRTWRDLLKSDPGVDLVHFTILREPTKLDATPQRELSLIAFPFRELFEIKLYDFDLIVFDRYSLNRILPDSYFRNIVRYVEEGGALLVSSGPDFTGFDSLYSTALAPILPGQPSDRVFKEAYLPQLNDNGHIHPVTAALQSHGAGGDNVKPDWGPWLRQVELINDGGDALMTGVNDSPLLVLDRIQEGRVAQLASDHIWLWSRGYKGGGPSAELLRRMVHWLMKEPELDEEALDVEVQGNRMLVKSRHFSARKPAVKMVRPDGSEKQIILEETSLKTFEAQITAEDLGVYSFEDDSGKRRYVVVGDNQPPELQAVVTTEDKLAALVRKTKGGVIWAEDESSPKIKFLNNPRSYAGSDFIGLRQNNSYIVNGVKTTPLFNLWLALASLVPVIALTWWAEGREKTK